MMLGGGVQPCMSILISSLLVEFLYHLVRVAWLYVEQDHVSIGQQLVTTTQTGSDLKIMGEDQIRTRNVD